MPLGVGVDSSRSKSEFDVESDHDEPGRLPSILSATDGV